MIPVSESRFERVIQTSIDLQLALSALTFVEEELSRLKCEGEQIGYVARRRLRCFEVAAVVSYARPFVHSRSGTTVSLKRLGFRFSDGERALHERIINHRNREVAHSDEDTLSFRTTPLEMNIPDREERLPPFVHIDFPDGLWLTRSDAEAMEMLIKRIMATITRFTTEVAAKQPELVERYKRRTRA